MNTTRPAFFLLLLLLLTTPAHAATLIETGTVKEILKPDMVLLEDGKRYRLDNIRIPTDNNSPALDELSHALLHKKVNVYASRPEGKDTDRYGVAFADLIRADGLWIQEDLVTKGLAWAMATPLLRAEQKARARKIGFWSTPAHSIKTPANVENDIDSFQVVEGKILDVTEKDDYTYLNFGADWKTDFTIELPREYGHLFPDPTLWKNRTVRIRGWVEERNGPMIRLTHPEQIEFLKK